MFGTERAALALIALITGVMGFIESMAAVPAGSTALAADALTFVQHSISAGFALWATAGTITRQRWTVQLQGFTMAILGALVVVIAVRRFIMGSLPHPDVMLIIGTLALGAHLTVGAIMLGQRGQPMSLKALWRLVRTDAVGNIDPIFPTSSSAAQWPRCFFCPVGASRFRADWTQAERHRARQRQHQLDHQP
jgi:Co/Zn/Cd efflux system component